ncbi:hypothetical protein MMC27_002672 [Xylographa pallens]|nr:hypothetical protein [Xylographa pallens]
MATEMPGMTAESLDTAPETVNTTEGISIPNGRTPSTLLSITQGIRDQIWRQLLSTSCVYEANATPQKYNFHPTILRVCRQTYKEGKQILYGRGQNLFVILKFSGPLAWTYSTLFKAVPAIQDQYFEMLPEAVVAISIGNIDDPAHTSSFEGSRTMITAIQSLDTIVKCFWRITSDLWPFSGRECDLQKMWVSFDFNPTILLRRTPLQLSLLAKLGSFASIGWLVVNYRHGHYEEPARENNTSHPSPLFSMGPGNGDAAEVIDDDTGDLLSSVFPENRTGRRLHSGQAMNFADFVYEAIQSPPTLASYLDLTEELFAEGNEALQSGRYHEARHKYQAIISFSTSMKGICDSWALPLDEISEKTMLCEVVYGETGSQHAIENAKIGIAKAHINMCEFEEALTVLSVFPRPPSDARTVAYFQLLFAIACFSIEAFTPGKRVFHDLQSRILDPFDRKFDIIVDIVRELAWAWSTDEIWGHTRRSIGPVEPWLAHLLNHCWKLLDALEQEERSITHVGLADEEESE